MEVCLAVNILVMLTVITSQSSFQTTMMAVTVVSTSPIHNPCPNPIITSYWPPLSVTERYSA